VKQLSKVILLIPSAREFDRGLRRGIVEYAQAHGPWIFCEEAPPYLQSLQPRRRLQNMREWNAQGMIVLQNRFAEVKSLRIPTIVAIGTHRLSPSCCQVICANEEIGRLGAKTLVGLGLRHFAYCGLEGLEFSDNRGLGFVQEVRVAGYSADVYSSPARHLGQSWYAEERQLARWLSALTKPIGLMACNDDKARMLAEICRSQEIRVPDDIAILGVDNDEQVCRSANPPLSSIALATERGGYAAAALLATLMSGRTPENKVITVYPSHTVPRQSTNTLAIDDPAIVRALRLVRENSNRHLRVADLTAASGLSRRALQDRFKQYLGRTPMEEIHHGRVERIARLLVETNMTVGEIAAASGFEFDAHVARFFSFHTGMTPLAYRKKNRIH
jgi:LacI family transcriptional regulator, galactose operon repressor